MDKLQPPTPAQEITPAEPVQEISDDDAVSVLPDLPAEQQQDLEQRADAWVDQVSALNPHSQEFTAQVNALGAVARRTFERTSQTSSRFMEQSLRDGKGKGNAELSVERRAPWDDLGALEKASHLLGLLDERAVRKADEMRATGKAADADALERDVLFAVRQRR